MKIINQTVHGVLDYAVAAALVLVPFLMDFGATHEMALWIPVAAGIALFVYSLLTGYSAGIRNVIPFKVHLMIDFIAAVALILVPILFGFGGLPQMFLWVVGAAVVVVVLLTDSGS